MKTFPTNEYPEAWSYELLEGKGLQGIAPRSCVLHFSGIADDETVYNPCPFVLGNELHILGRVEARASEISHVYEFKKENDKWLSQEVSFLHVQDPFLTCIHNRKVVGGVALEFSEPFPGVYTIENYHTTFFDFETKEKIADGPNEMKDIRLIDVGEKIGVFTRPRREADGVVHSSIQFDIVDQIEDITPERISAISIDPLKKVKGFFNYNEWGGINAVYHLADGWLGVLGHIAYYSEYTTPESPGRTATDEHLRKYAAIAFEFNPETKEVTYPVIILARNNLHLTTYPKREDLRDVIFPGGLVFLRSTEATAKEVSDDVLFFYGISDTHIGVSELPYPFHHPLDLDSEHNQLFIMDRAKALHTVGLSQ